MKPSLRHGLCFLLALGAATSDAASQPKRPDRERDRILQQLRHKDPAVVRSALGNLDLARRERKLSVEQRLIELVDSKSAEFRRIAIDLLGDIGPAAHAAFPVLEVRLRDPDREVRTAAATAVWRIGQRADLGVPVFLQVLRSDDRWVSNSAVLAFQEMGPAAASALKPLLALIQDQRTHVRAHAATALGALGPKYRSQVEEPLQAALEDAAGEVRIAAAGAIGEVDGSLDQAVRVLAKMVAEKPKDAKSNQSVLADSNPASSAAKALGMLEGDAAPATHALAEALTSPSLAVRLEAATALGRIGPAASDAIPALSKALRETEGHSIPFVHRVWCVGDNAAEALESIGMTAVTTLVDALDDPQPEVREDAVRALGGIPEAAPQTVGPLSQRLQDPHPLVLIEAAKAIAKFAAAGAEAAPHLAGLLLDDRAFTAFRSGSGIGHTESVRDAALLALLKIEPKADIVVRVLVRSLEQADDVPYETIAALRAFDGRVAATMSPLERLLSNKNARTGAASALAFVDPKRAGLRAILEDGLFDGERLDPIAAVGLGRLAERGEKFDDRVRRRVYDLVHESGDLFGLCSLLRRDPTDEPTAKLLVEALRYAHDVFDAIGIRETELTLRELAKHRSVKDALLAEMELVVEEPEMSEYDRLRREEYARLQAARILVAAQLELEQAVDCLEQLSTRENGPVQGEAADILADCQTERQAAIAVLIELLSNNGSYVGDGDFYGNGGEWRVVGDRAARALVALRASSALHARLSDEDVDVRIRAIGALGKLGEDALTDELLQGALDSDHRVRRETMSALGRLGRAHVASREKLEGTLEAAARNDRRRSVRDEAKRALRSWK